MFIAFIVSTLLIALILSPIAFSFFFVFDFSKKIKIFCLIGYFIISGFFSISICHSAKKEVAEWNNGYCPECGEKWEIFDIERTGRYGQYETYYYICNNCGNTTRQMGD